MDYNKILLDQCKQKVKSKLLGYENITLKHSDLLKLSEEIFRFSNISLSLSTLKRVFREDYSVSPQINTLDALAIYLGYKGWIAYVQENTIGQTRNTNHIKSRFFYHKRILYLISGIIIVSLMVGIAIIKKTSNSKNRYAGVEFSYTFLNKPNIPPGVKFHFDISGIEFERAQIWPLGNGNDGFDIKPNDSVAISGYGWYDTFYPKLVIDDSIVAQLEIDIQSYTWKAAISKLTEKEFILEYCNEEEIFTHGELAITDEILAKHKFNHNSIDNLYYCIARNFKHINGDTLNFETKIRTTQIYKGDIAGVHLIRLAFQNGVIQLPITEKHFNISFPFGTFNEWKAPDKNDLSVFKINPDSWNTINIFTSNKTAEIRINDKLILSQKFNAEPGFLKRIEYIIYGMGEVDYVRFFNQNNDLIFNNSFD